MNTSPPGEILTRRQHLFEQLNSQAPALLLTTDPGLEDLAAAEAADLFGDLIRPGLYERRPYGFHGHVLIQPGRHEPAISDLVLQMRSIHHVVEPRYAFRLPKDNVLETIRSTLRERGVEGTVARDGTFRVTTSRHGEHNFSSMQVQQCAGAALVERYGMGVDLENFDTEIRVDIRHDHCIVGLQLSRERLSKRSWRRYHPRASVRANIAYALLRFAGRSEGRLLDPFCGSGTIPIEAAHTFPDLQISASDYSMEAISGARRNVRAAEVEQRVPLALHDMHDLIDLHPESSFDLIVTNPPYGIRVGQGMNFFAFYRGFLQSAAHLLRPGGRLVFLAWKRGVVDKVLQQDGLFRRRHALVIEMGGIYLRIYVMDRL